MSPTSRSGSDYSCRNRMDFWNASPDYGFLNADFLLVIKP